jgi:hypothetical protein
MFISKVNFNKLFSFAGQISVRKLEAKIAKFKFLSQVNFPSLVWSQLYETFGYKYLLSRES